jgi:phage tail tape-measure protein
MKKRKERELEQLVETQSANDVAAAEAMNAAAGAAAGAAFGVLGGPAAMAAGAAIGAAAGAVLGHIAAEADQEKREIDNDLDGVDAEEEFFHERNSLGVGELPTEPGTPPK